MKVQPRTILMISIVGAVLAALLVGGSAMAKILSVGGSAGGAPAAAPASAPASAPVAAVQAPLILTCSTASFGAPTNFTVGTNPYSVAVGDFNRDGNPDVATAN
jgi:hypothetical protein